MIIKALWFYVKNMQIFFDFVVVVVGIFVILQVEYKKDKNEEKLEKL